MSTITEDLQASVDDIAISEAKARAISRGASTDDDVVVEGGTVKPFAKVAAEGAAAFTAALGSSVDEANAVIALATAEKVAAEAAKDAALIAQGNAEDAESGAEAAQTSASASATTASNEAAAAATSAQAAVDALIELYDGTSPGDSLPPTLSEKGKYRRISEAGTSQGYTWGKGDIAIYEGSSGSYSRVAMDTYGFALNSEIKSTLSIKSNEGRAVSNGSIGHRALRWLPREIGEIAGLPITIYGILPVLKSNPSTRVQIHAITDNSGNSSLESSQRNHTLHFYYDTNGDLVIKQVGAVFSDRRDLTYDGFLTDYSDYDFVRFALCFPNPDTTTAPELWVEGVDIVSSMTLSTANTIPNWVPPTMETVWGLTGYLWPAGDMPKVSLVLGAFSSAEAEAYTKGGRAPVWAEKAGSAIGIYESDFSLGSDSWVGMVSTIVSGNQDSIGGVDDSLLVEVGGSVANARRFGHGLVNDEYYHISVDFYYPSANDDLDGLKIADNGSSSRVINDAEWRSLSADTWHTLTATGKISSSEDLSSIRLVGMRDSSSSGQTTGDKFYVKNIKFIKLGSIYKPYFQPGLVVGDQIGRISARALGCAQMPEPGVRDISIDVEFAYSGSSIQILGGDLLGGLDARIISVSGYSDQNTTGSLGVTSGGTQLVNAQSIDGNFDISTFASRIISAGTSLYWTPGANPTAGKLNIVLRPIN